MNHIRVGFLVGVARSVLLFALLAALWPAQQVWAQDSDGDGMANSSVAGQDYAEVFSAGDSNSGIVYINWQEPQATNDHSREAWFRGAYRFFNDGSLIVELSAEGGSASGGERGSLTNNLRYALSYAAGTGAESAIYLSLLTTNGVVLAASEDLLTSSNVAHYVIPAEAGIQSNATVLLVNVPTAEYPEAAVIQLIATEDGIVPTIVGKSALYIDEDGDGWTATDELRNETSDYIFNATGGGTSNYYDWINGAGGGSSTNNTGGGGSTNNPGGGPGAATGYIYVSQSIGSDNLTGRAPEVRGNDGPKKTISQGLAAVDGDGAHTLIINSGHYGEDLDLRGKKLRVVIAGNVRL